MPAHPSMRAKSPRAGSLLRRLPRPGRSTPTTMPASPPSTRTSCCACSLKWRICGGGPIARSRMRASTASPTSRATFWRSPTTWRARGAFDAKLREQADAGTHALLDGVELTERELAKVLEKHGVKKFDPLGEKFDPNLHQAMYEIPDASRPAGSVAQVVQPGYMIGDRVLRPALVGVAKGGPKPAAEPPANDNGGSSARNPPN